MVRDMIIILFTSLTACCCHYLIIQEWYNTNLDFIADVTEFTPPALRLEEPTPVRDIATITTNQNKVEMIRAYCFALVAYHRTCQKLQLHVNQLYTPLLIAGEDDDQ